MAGKTAREVELRDRQWEYLQQMADRYDIPDVSKAIRVLIDFAAENPDQELTIFNEKRCLDC